ncbi:MAG: diacylglycerol kinase family protein [Hyphomicrobiaceae bacterium]
MHVLINARAGTVIGADAEAVADSVSRRLADAGHDVGCEIVAPERLSDAFARIRTMPPEVLLVGAGDGTVRHAAETIIGSETTLGVLPLGTINRLARDLGIPLDYEQAADALAQGHVRSMDVAELNGRIFLCNAMLGLTTQFSSERQKLRGKSTLERVTGYLSVVRNLLRGQRRIAVSIDDGTGSLHTKVISLVVTNNPFTDEASLALHRPELDKGRLAAYAARHAAGWQVAGAALRAMLGRLDGDSKVIQLQSSRLTVDLPARSQIRLSIDGEVEDVATPLRFTIRPKALKVLVPGDNA